MEAESFLDYDPNIPWEEEDVLRRKHLALINLDNLFYTDPTARLINGDSIYSAKRVENFKAAIFQSIDGEIGFVPICECGYVSGVYNTGVLCPRCNTVCSNQFVNSLNHTTWMWFPDTMYTDRYGQVKPILGPVLHPVWWSILKKWTAVNLQEPERIKTSYIEIIVDPTLPIPEELLVLGLDRFKNRGFQWLYENADRVLNFFMYECPKTYKKSIAAWMVPFREQYRDCMFTRHLPILHNSLTPSKQGGVDLTYVDENAKNLMHAVLNLSDLLFRVQTTPTHPKRVLVAQAKVYYLAFAYYDDLLKRKLGGKTAIIRKHNCGSRLHFSARSVIVAPGRALQMDEIILPWGIIVNLLKHVILNYLTRRFHLGNMEAFELFHRSLREYNSMIDQCIKMYMQETGENCVYVQMGRNPQLGALG